MNYEHLERLLTIGFRPVGAWILEGVDLALDLRETGIAGYSLYAFVSDDEVKYIGKTNKPLRERLYAYLHPGPTQSTFIKIRRRIVEALSEGNSVEIYALPDEGLIQYGGFHLNLAAGLEDSLVEQLKPPWNRTGAKNLQLFT
jgi:hypothetical protein